MLVLARMDGVVVMREDGEKALVVEESAVKVRVARIDDRLVSLIVELIVD